MKIEHYNAIAKIVGGTLNNNDRLYPMVNTLTSYFESVDESFDAKEFRSACLNGHLMEESSSEVVKPSETPLTPSSTQKTPDN